MKYNLLDLIDVKEKEKLLQSFYDAVGIPAAIVDLDGVVLVSSRWQRARADFHRQNDITRTLCTQSDTIPADSLLEGKTHSLYRCENGLMDAASPIIIEGEHLANMFIGQFFVEKPDMEYFRAQARRFGFDEAEYLEAISEIPVVAEETLPAILSFLTSFAVMVGALGLKRLEHANIEKELRDAERDMKRAQTVARVGSWRMDVKRNVLHWSDETYNIFGVPLNTPMNYEKFLALVYPDDIELVDREWRAALSGKPYDVEHRIIAGGSTKWVREQAVLEFNDNGDLLGGFGTVQDITERKHAEEALILSEERFRRLVEVSSQMVWVTDDKGEPLEDSPSWRAFTGSTREQWFGWNWLEACHPDDRERVAETWRTALSNASPYRVEARMRSASGDYRHILAQAAPIINADGGVREWVGMNTDITQQKDMEDILRRSRDELEARIQERTAELSEALKKVEITNKDLEDFAYIASHDLQEPLRKIQAFLTMIRDRIADKLDPASEEYFERIENAADRMRRLIQDLLRLSRIATQPQPMAPVDLNRVAADALQVFEHRLSANGGKIQISSLPTIQADEAQMRQLFQNIMSNALKFQRQEEKPSIRVYCEPDGSSTCRIYFEDNGIGFDERFLGKIFAPFQRLHGRDTRYEGTGMGLAICRKIVERHGGSITARSEPGKGSTFIVTLPCDLGPEASEPVSK